jgi:hypothetical protein
MCLLECLSLSHADSVQPRRISLIENFPVGDGPAAWLRWREHLVANFDGGNVMKLRASDG